MNLPAPDPNAPFFIVLNAASGSSDTERTRQTIADVLTQAGRVHHIECVHDSGHLAAIAQDIVAQARAQGGIVVAAGGDGTINAVVQATLGSGCTFGVLPQGTFNYFGRVHGIPADTAEATRLLLDGRIKHVQVGRVNERIFIVNASLGLYPQLLETREEWKQQFGRSRLVALWAGLFTFLGGHRQMTLEIEHAGRTRTLHTPTLFVGNNRLQLEQIGIPEAAALQDGQLAAIALRPTGRLAMLWLLARGALGRLGEADQVTSFSFSTLRLRPLHTASFGGKRRRRIKVATDGEVGWMQAPLQFSVAADALPLIVPDDSAP